LFLGFVLPCLRYTRSTCESKRYRPMGSRGQNSVASHFGSIRPSQIQASIQTFTLSLPLIWSFLNPFPGLTLAVNISLASSFPISLWLSHRTITLSVLCVAVLPYLTCTHTCATVHCNRSSSACSHARRSSPSSPGPGYRDCRCPCPVFGSSLILP
jgi:hypothetical protein